MPVFCGDNPNGWLYHAERYFEVNGLTYKGKLRAVGVSLDGDALAWLRWIEEGEPFQTWEQFRRRLLPHFPSTREGSLCEKLTIETRP